MAIVAAITAVLFVAAGILIGDFGRAWDVLSGTCSPFGAWSTLTVPLSVLGYLVLPVFIALAVTDGLTSFIRHRQRDPSFVESGVATMLNNAYAKWEREKRENGDPG